MSGLTMILRELLGLFLDDEFLAIGILAVVGISAVLLHSVPGAGLFGGFFLAFGCLAILVTSCVVGARKKR